TSLSAQAIAAAADFGEAHRAAKGKAAASAAASPKLLTCASPGPRAAHGANRFSPLGLRLHACVGFLAALFLVVLAGTGLGHGGAARWRGVVAEIACGLFALDDRLDLVARKRLVFQQTFGD